VGRKSEDVLWDPPPAAADERLAYGPEPKQFGDLRLPPGAGAFPLAIVIHGGYWKAQYNLIHVGHMCVALAARGIATWNVEYRCVGDVGGGWPGSGEDVCRAVGFADELRRGHALAGAVLVGHSAGAQLALVAAKRFQLPVAALAPVTDLADAASRNGAGSATAQFMGGPPDELPERYAQASPRELLPIGVRQVVLHGTDDTDVPYAMSAAYVEAAKDEAELIPLEGAGHFEPIDPLSREWPQTLAAIELALSR
jgi:acetyl esterase/lipase